MNNRHCLAFSFFFDLAYSKVQSNYIVSSKNSSNGDIHLRKVDARFSYWTKLILCNIFNFMIIADKGEPSFLAESPLVKSSLLLALLAGLLSFCLPPLLLDPLPPDGPGPLSPLLVLFCNASSMSVKLTVE